MYKQVGVLNRSLRICQWSQLRSVAQVNVKDAESLDGGVPVHNKEWINAKPTSEMPGPSQFQLIRGFLPGGIFYKNSVIDFVKKSRQLYGDTFMIPGVFGKKSMVIGFNADDIPTVLRSEGVWPLRRGLGTMNYHRTVHRKDDYGGVIGLLGSNNEEWGKLRSAVNPVLMQTQNARLYLSKMLEVNDEFLQRIREIRDPQSLEVPDTFENEINRLTFESVAVVALNKQLGLIRKHRDNEDAKKLFESLRTMFSLFADLEINPSLWRYVSTSKFRKMMKSCDTMHDIIMKLINEALERIEMEKSVSNQSGEEKSLLEKLLKIDKKVAVVMALDMLMAGVDTTSTTLAGILLCIATNPDKQEILRQELCAILPQKDSPLTISNMKNLPYLRACIKESMRIYPIGSGSPRTAGDDIVMSGYRVPKHHDIFINTNLLLMEEKFFPKANQFIPERWLRDENGDKPAMNPFLFIPFGFGPRSCVGKRIVEMELEITLARLVRNFNMEFNYSTENAFRNILINVPAIPLKFKFSEVDN